jgi:Spy/CpxP family protein refolding chaperone
MKRVWWLAAAVMLVPMLSFCSQQAAGQVPLPGVQVPAPGAGWGAGINVKSPAAFYIESIDKIVNLTEDQKKASTKIFEERERLTKQFQAEHGEQTKAALSALSAAYKTKDKEAIAKASKGYQDACAPLSEVWKKSQAKLTRVLTPQQQAKLREHQLTTMLKGVTAPVNLSEEQVERIRRASQAEPGDAWGMKVSKVIEEVLAVEQKTAIAKHRLMDAVRTMFGRAKLTAEQLKNVEAACDELVKGQSKLGLASGLYSKLAEKVNGLLTAAQKEAMKKAPQMPLGRPGAPATQWRATKDPWKSAAEFYVQRMDKVVNLTAAQKSTIQRIFDCREKLTKAFYAQNAEKVKAVTSGIGEAFKSKNNAAIAKAGGAYAEFFAPIHEFIRESQAALDNVLTPEQKAQLHKHRAEAVKKARTPGGWQVGGPVTPEGKREGVTVRLHAQKLPGGGLVYMLPAQPTRLKGVPLPGGGVMFTIPELGGAGAGGFGPAGGTAEVLKSQLRQAIGLLRQAGLGEEADRVQQKLNALEGLFPYPKGTTVYRPAPGQPGGIMPRP